MDADRGKYKDKAKTTASPRPGVSASPRPRVPASASPHIPASPRPRVSASPRRSILLLSVVCLLLTAACRQDMQDQPRMKPYRSTTFFSNGLSSRPPVTGTVPRGYLRADRAFFTGKKNTAATSSNTNSATQAATGQQPDGQQATYPDDVEEFPLPITPEIVARGRERFEIFCSVCHGMTGNGDGMIVRRGYRRAASFHTDALRQAPVGHFFDAITNGWGAMPAYASQIPPQDRWAIVAYICALQLSNTQTQLGTATTPAAPSPAATPASGGHD